MICLDSLIYKGVEFCHSTMMLYGVYPYTVFTMGNSFDSGESDDMNVEDIRFGLYSFDKNKVFHIRGSNFRDYVSRDDFLGIDTSLPFMESSDNRFNLFMLISKERREFFKYVSADFESLNKFACFLCETNAYRFYTYSDNKLCICIKEGWGSRSMHACLDLTCSVELFKRLVCKHQILSSVSTLFLPQYLSEEEFKTCIRS